MSGASPFSRQVYPVAEAGGLGVHMTLEMAGQARSDPDLARREGDYNPFDAGGQ